LKKKIIRLQILEKNNTKKLELEVVTYLELMLII